MKGLKKLSNLKFLDGMELHRLLQLKIILLELIIIKF